MLTFGTGDTGQLGLGGVMERKKPAVVSMDEGIVQVRDVCLDVFTTVAQACQNLTPRTCENHDSLPARFVRLVQTRPMMPLNVVLAK